MIDYTDSLIKTIASHTSKLSSVNLPDKINLFGDTLRYAHQSITSVLTSTKITTCIEPIPTTIQGQLTLTIVEARNLNITDTNLTDIYCKVDYGSNTMSTLDRPTRHSVDPSPNVIRECSTKWQYSQSLDVTADQGEMMIQVYGQISNGNDLLLGMTTWIPSFEQHTMDIWLPLKPPLSTKELVIPAGQIRLQVRFTQLGPTTTRMTPSSFRIIQQIGHGSFGKVYKVEKRDTKEIYAMKVLSKRLLVDQNEVNHTISERNVLIRTIDSPFIVNLQYSFQTASHLFLVMDYLPGGDLYTYLQHHRTLTEDQARFILAELVCALSDLHANNVIYRDLKPENVLLDGHGHVALTDFGFCKELKDKETSTGTFCGTTEYMAPEMVLKDKYTLAIDWWCLGILLYELVTGLAPFHSVHLDTLYRRILKQPIIFPSINLSMDCKDLIQQLLQRDPSKRLGAKNIKLHPFFNNNQHICWDLVAKKQSKSPLYCRPSSLTPATTAIDIRPSQSHSFSGQPLKQQLDLSSSLGSQVSFLTKDSIPLDVSTQNAFQGFSYTLADDLLYHDNISN
ncbi:kinase-like domain-containing protein [Chlamydoabsidia padenii]|nr:kinase-like domain-containing protein [Chlamydoabsidia padenii]